MIKNFIAFAGKRQWLQIAFGLYVLGYLAVIASRFYGLPFAVMNNDNYKDLFLVFLDKGYYQANVIGTSILYNVCLKAIYSFTHSVDASFFTLNAACDLFYLVFGWYFFTKLSPFKGWHHKMLMVMYSLFVMNQMSYLAASNDTFLGVFVIGLLYFLLVKIWKPKVGIGSFIGVGILLAAAFATRMTAVFLLPLVVIALVFWWRQSVVSAATKIKWTAASAITFTALTFALYYPSLIEKHQLSYESKEPGNGLNWTQRNYLGLKKIEQGKEAMNRDAIWVNTKFDVVAKYVEEHGEDSLPKSISQVAQRDPLLLTKVGLYNGITVILRFFRFWGLLFVLPFIALLTRRKLTFSGLPVVLFVVFATVLSFACFTFMEFRWFLGYEILVPIGMLLWLDDERFRDRESLKNALFTISLLVITLFNLKTIVGTWM